MAYKRMLECPTCGKDLSQGNSGRHVKFCHLYKNLDGNEIQLKYDNYKDVKKSYVKYGLKNGLLKKRKFVGHKHTDEQKKEISKKRLKGLKENPDKHPGKNNSKFISKPCEKLKDELRKNSIEFKEEMQISNERLFCVDILIPSKNLIIEVNGNQHYNKDGTLKEYYQDRHNYIKSLGGNIIELHFSLVYNFKYCLNIINNYDDSLSVLPFYIKESKKKQIVEKKLLNKKSKKEHIDHMSSLIKSSSINFSSQGGVEKVSKILKITPQKVTDGMRRNMLEFGKEKCYKRKGTYMPS